MDPSQRLSVQFGISDAGTKAEQRFVDDGCVADAKLLKRGAPADAELTVGDNTYYFEIKKTSDTTLNQVRAIRFHTLVVLKEPEGQWYVFPPDVVVDAVCSKDRRGRQPRGQHCENPFETSALSLTALKTKYSCVPTPDSDLRKAVLKAARRGESKAADLRAMMAASLDRAEKEARRAVKAVQARLDTDPVGPL